MPKKRKANILLAVSEQPDSTDKIIADLRLQLADSHTEIALLRQKIDLLIRQVFGSKSERLDPAQLELLLNENKGTGPNGT